MAKGGKGKGKATGSQPTLASFYSSSSATAASSSKSGASTPTNDAQTTTTEGSHMSDIDDVEDVDEPPHTSSQPSLATTIKPDLSAPSNKTRRISEIPPPSLTSKLRAHIAKEERAATAIVGPLDHLMGSNKATALPAFMESSAAAPKPTTRKKPKSPPNATPSIIVLASSSPPPDPSSETVIDIRDDSPEASRTLETIASPSLRPAPLAMSRSNSASKSLHTKEVDAGKDRESAIDLTNQLETPQKKPKPPSRPAFLVFDDPAWPAALADHTNVSIHSYPSPIPHTILPKRSPLQRVPSTTPGSWWEAMHEHDEELPVSPHLPSSVDIGTIHISSSDPAFLSIPGKHHVGTHDLWSTKYRPVKAQQVLGNQLNAQFIKDWLRALELLQDTPVSAIPTASQSKSSSKTSSAIKRPRVVRAVEKRVPVSKKRKVTHGYDDDWVVDDDDEEIDEDVLSEEDEVAPSNLAEATSRNGSPSKRFSVPPPAVLSPPTEALDPPKYDFSGRLTNALLVTGPSGCGKTAAVHACAEELGWGIIEVNAGMGKRGGAQITNLLDGVGKNHTLGGPRSTSSSKTSQGNKGGLLDSLFAKAKTASSQVINLDVEGAGGPSKGSVPPPSAKKVNQSIILLEEVDLLFPGETNFWPAVIDIIKDSRRPVIMTCNDPSSVPIDDLPLQDILTFQPPSNFDAISYLSQICRAEGWEVPFSTVESIYSQSLFTPTRVDNFDLSHPVPSQPPPTSDFRHALLQLQALYGMRASTQVPRHSHDDEVATLANWQPPHNRRDNPSSSTLPSDLCELRSLSSFMDDVSLSDCLEQPIADLLEALLNDHYETIEDTELNPNSKPRPDDVLGVHLLPKPIPHENSPLVPAYSREPEIVLSILQRTRLAHLGAQSSGTNTLPVPLSQSHPFSPTALPASAASYQAQALVYLENHLSLSSPLFPRSPIFLDYIPWLTHMVRADDEQEQADSIAIHNLQLAAAYANPSGGRMRTTRNSMRGTFPSAGSSIVPEPLPVSGDITPAEIEAPQASSVHSGAMDASLPRATVNPISVQHRLGMIAMRRWMGGNGKFPRYLDMPREHLDLVRNTALVWRDPPPKLHTAVVAT